jgi:hypothetical protein
VGAGNSSMGSRVVESVRNVGMFEKSPCAR